MENIHSLKYCPWITEDPINLKEYFGTYHDLLDFVSNGPHEQKVSRDEALHKFFSSAIEKFAEKKSGPNSPFEKDIEFEDQNERPFPKFDLAKVEEDCSVDLLTVDAELPTEDTAVSIEAVRHSGSITNWYAGAFEDGIIPASGEEVLQTLKEQAAELSKREHIRDYARLRYRLLKYFSTIRMITDEHNHPEPTRKGEDHTVESLRDIILNVRVQRPYHKKTHMKKACNRFPTHSQELLLLGSQKLTDLRDALICINDLGVNQDFSPDPQIYHLSHLPNNSVCYPSGFFYINGVFYNDVRHPEAKLYSDNIIKWSKKHSEIGELTTEIMHETRFIDLEIRLGFPYVYVHQGNCEHLIVFTDVRMTLWRSAEQCSATTRGRTSVATRCAGLIPPAVSSQES
ncbi:uncharacterized protein Pbp49 [Palaemon carinicauda]|uniref:uncharacterized protein Pbp49 n=1 Tax=Palaemon carinicauda TaxID=392227 RepID=UPI0035B68CA8